MSEQSGSICKHFMKLERKSASLYVQNTGRQQCAPGFGWGPGIRNHYLLHYVLSGKGIYICRGQRYELQAGDAFLILPGTTVRYHADEREPWEYVWVGFGGLDAADIMAQTDLTWDEPVLWAGERSETLCGLMREVAEGSGAASWEQLTMTARLYNLLAFLVHTTLSDAGQREKQDCAQVAAEYIVTHYEEPITVEWLAAYTSVSHSSLYRRFMKRFEMSPKRFLLEYRVERACHLLTGTDLSVQEISNSVGFEDPFYFSRAFKEIKGVSPRQYANERKKSLSE